jgi:mono/diheme cytochrome c family protein
VLFVTTLKRGSLYVLPLKAGGKTPAGPFSRYFQSENRFRDTAISPDGRTIYVATDSNGLVESASGGVTSKMRNPGAIIAYTYEGEGADVSQAQPAAVSEARPAADAPAAGAPPTFTAAQAAAGKVAYNANCAVCHGSTMTNGTFGTPLAGEYFKKMWSGRNAKAFFDKSRTMPPAAPGSLPADTYANIIAYILEVNGFASGAAKLPAGGDALSGMSLK